MRNIQLKIIFLLFLLVGLFGISCEEPLSPRYDNSSDPTSQAYIPTGPADLSVSVVNDSVFTLQWNDQSLGEDGFKLFLNSENDSVFKLIGNIQKNSTSYKDTLAKLQNIKYKYRLYAFKGNNLSKTYREATTQFSFKAPLITGVSGTDSSKLTIKWRNNDSFLTEMIVERSETSSFNIVGIASPGQNEFVDSTVSKYHTYQYRVTPNANHNTPTSSNTYGCGYQITGDSLVKEIKTNSVSVSCGGLSNDNQLCLVADRQQCRVLDISKGIIIRTIDLPVGSNKSETNYYPTILAISNNKQIFAIVRDTIVYVHNIINGTLIRRIAVSHTKWNYDLAITYDGLQVIVNIGGKIQCWNISDGSLAWEISFSSSRTSIWLHPDGKRLLVGNASNCYFLDVRTGVILFSSMGGFFVKNPALCNGSVIIATMNGYCYNVTNNITEFILKHNHGETMYLGGICISKDKLFVASEEGGYTDLRSIITGNYIYNGFSGGSQRYLQLINNDQQLLIYADNSIGIFQLKYNWSSIVLPPW